MEARSQGSIRGLDESVLIARLKHLEGLRLAERVGPVSWSLSPGWKEELRELDTRGDILKQIHRAVDGEPSRYRAVRPGEALGVGVGKKLVGRVAGKGLADEAKGAFYAVVETPEGEAFHLHIDARTAEAVRTGDLVAFGTRPEPAVRPVDRRIAELARGLGGQRMLDPALAGEDRARVARRLRQLERDGLVSSVGPERWSVPSDLIDRLERRQPAAPAREQVLMRKLPLSLELTPGYQGPVWLDHVDEQSLATRGFGAEVRRTVEQRRDTLRSLGIAPGDPHGGAKLRELERRAVGEGMAARTQQKFLVDTPHGFRGRLDVGVPGAAYLAVSDGARFVLVPATRDFRALAGSAVVVTRDALGRFVVRRIERERDR